MSSQDFWSSLDTLESSLEDTGAFNPPLQTTKPLKRKADPTDVIVLDDAPAPPKRGPLPSASTIRSLSSGRILPKPSETTVAASPTALSGIRCFLVPQGTTKMHLGILTGNIQKRGGSVCAAVDDTTTHVVTGLPDDKVHLAVPDTKVRCYFNVSFDLRVRRTPSW